MVSKSIGFFSWTVRSRLLSLACLVCLQILCVDVVLANASNWSAQSSTLVGTLSEPAPSCGSFGGCHGSGNDNTSIGLNVANEILVAGATTFSISRTDLGVTGPSFAWRYKVGNGTASGYLEDVGATITVPSSGNSTVHYCVGEMSGGQADPRNIKCSNFTVSHAAPAPPGVIDFTDTTFSGSEASGQAIVKLARTGGSNGTVIATIVASPNAPATTADFSGSPYTVTWGNGVTADQTLTIPITDDSVVDAGESLSIRITNVTGGASIGLPNSATVNITDNDVAPSGSIAFSSTSYNGAESTGKATIRLDRTGGSNGAVTATVVATPGVGATAADFSGSPYTVMWANGDAVTKEFDIPVTDDAVFDPLETLSIRISSVAGASTGSPSTATVNINDNDSAPVPGTITFNSASFSGSEASGAASITLRRSVGTSGAVTATVTTAASADITGNSFSVSWDPGESGTQILTIPVVDDSIFEGNESFSISISSVSGGANIGSPSNATVTIADNDPAPPTPVPGTVAFAGSTFSGSEASGSATVTLSRSVGTSGAVTATVTTAASADITGNSFSVSWDPGESGSQTLTIPIVDDSAVEGDETFSISLSSASGGATIGSPANATVTIADNDSAPPTPVPGTIAFAANSFSGSEASGSATITLERSIGNSGAITATVDTAASADITGNSFSVSWGAGESGSKTLTIPVVDDSEVEGSETFSISISSVSGGATIGSPANATVTIADNDSAPPTPVPGTIAFAASSFSGSEASGSATITLERSIGNSGAVTATVTTAPSTDITGSSFSVTWNAGEIGSQSLTIPVVDDAVDEGNETFTVSISSVTGGASIGSPNTASVTLTDNDSVVIPPPVPGTACTGEGRTLAIAKADYALNCSLPRLDCDPVSTGWVCSSEQIGSSRPLTQAEITESQQGTACVATGRTLRIARLNYSNTCTVRRRDCDPVNGSWMCSSQVIGTRAPSFLALAASASAADSVTRESEADRSAQCACMNDSLWGSTFLASVTTGEYGQTVLDPIAGDLSVSVYRGIEQTLLSASFDSSSSILSCAVSSGETGSVISSNEHRSNYADANRCAELLIDDAVPQPAWLRVQHTLTTSSQATDSELTISINGSALVHPDSYQIDGLDLSLEMIDLDVLWQAGDDCGDANSGNSVVLQNQIVDINEDPHFQPESMSTGTTRAVSYTGCEGELEAELTFPEFTWIPFARNGGQILRGGRLTD